MKFLSLLAALTFAGGCLAQQAATISGEVRGTDGHVVSGVTLQAIGSKTGEKRSSVSSDNGTFVFPAVPADTYQITAAHNSSSGSSTTVTVAAGQSRTVQLSIPTDSATTLVAIDTQTTTIETTSSRLGVNLTAAETGGLPANGRTFAPLTLTAPGVVSGGTATFNDIRFNGQSGGQNDIRLDGVDASSIVSASPGFSQVPNFLFRLQASLDSIEEFRIDSALYPATEGQGSGGHVDLTSKSGTDYWHGAFSEYFRNDKLDARNFFDGTDHSPLRMNQFGGNFGGPLVKNRLYIFGTAEQLKQRTGFNLLEEVPSAEARASAKPVIQSILAGVPIGTPTSDPDVNTAVKAVQSKDDELSYGVRFDFAVSAKDRVFARETRASGSYATPDSTTAPRTIASTLHSDHFVARWNRIQSAKLINDFSFGLNRSRDRLSIESTAPGAQGILVNFGNDLVQPGSLFPLRLGYIGRDSSLGGNHYQLGDILTVVHGAHTLKAGGEVAIIRLPFSMRGGAFYHFLDLDSFLGNSDADLTFSADILNRVAAQTHVAAFVQDEWRISPTVLINLGLRYERYSATREVNDEATLMDPFSFVTRPASGGFYPTSNLDLHPRIGISWSPKATGGKTVIRIGAGSYQTPVSVLETLQPIFNGSYRFFVAGTQISEAGLMNSYAQLKRMPSGLDESSFERAGRNYQYGVSVQQSMPGRFVAQAAYVGSVARHLEQWGQSNPITSLAGNSLTPVRVNDAYGAINYVTNGGKSNYNGLSLNVTRRLVDDLTLGATYGWSHSIGDTLGADDMPIAQNPACISCERASNAFDIRHVLAANVLYELPFGSHGAHLRQGLLGSLLGGWTTGAVLNLRSGLPLDVSLERPDEIYFDSVSNTYHSSVDKVPATAEAVMNVPGGGESRPNLRPDLVGGVDPYLHSSNGMWLNPAAFRIPRPGTYGNLGRNSLRGPGFSQLDLQVSRRVHLTERQSFILRADAFNLFDKTNFANPKASLPNGLVDLQPGSAFSSMTAPGFGQLTSTVGRTVGLGTSRQIQLSLRYEF